MVIFIFIFFKERATIRKVQVKLCSAVLYISHRWIKPEHSSCSLHTLCVLLRMQLKGVQRCCGISSCQPWHTRSTLLLIQGIYCWREKCQLKMSEERWWPSAGATNLPSACPLSGCVITPLEEEETLPDSKSIEKKITPALVNTKLSRLIRGQIWH